MSRARRRFVRELRPKRGTVRLTALCSRCDGVMYRWPWPGAEWHHDDGGDACEPES